jgi:hypothetical protein
MKSVTTHSPAFEDDERKSRATELLIQALKVLNGGNAPPGPPPSGCSVRKEPSDGGNDNGSASAYAENDETDWALGERKCSVSASNAGDAVDALTGERLVRHDDAYDSFRECWPRLTKRQRQIVLLHFRDGLSVTKIMGILGLKSAGTISEHLTSALECRDDHTAKMLVKIGEERRKQEEQANQIKPKKAE